MTAFDALGAVVWAVSNDTVANLKGYAARAGLSFPLLSNSDLSVIKAYGILNEHQEIAYPTTFVIDRSGTVRYAREDVDFRVRPSPDELLAALRALPPTKTR